MVPTIRLTLAPQLLAGIASRKDGEHATTCYMRKLYRGLRDV